jgi:hypothetical protein
MDRMGATERLRARLGKAEMLDLACRDEVFHRACHIFDRYIRVNAMLVIQIDNVGFQALQRRLSNLPDVRGAAVKTQTLMCCGIEVEAELGGNHHMVADRGKGFAHELFVDKRAEVSAVSKKVTPRSTAARITAIMSCRFDAGP